MARWFLCTLLLLAGLVAGGCRLTGPSSPLVCVTLSGPPGSEAAVPPVAYWSEVWTTPRPVCFHVLRLDLSDPDYEVCALVSPDPDGEGPAEATLQSPLHLAHAAGVLAAVNANAFGHLATATDLERARGWFAGKWVDIAGLAAVDGALRSPPDPALASVWTDAAGTPHIGTIQDPQGARQGVCSWIDHLLADGEIVARPDQQLHPRTLVGVDAAGRVLLLVVADGRQKGYSEGISLSEAAEFMKQHGCHDATNLDGGGSSIMLARTTLSEGGGLTVLNRPSGGRPRPIPVMLAIRQRISADRP